MYYLILCIYLYIHFNIIFYNFVKKIHTHKEFNDYSQFYNFSFPHNSKKIYTPHIKNSFYKYIVITISTPCNINSRDIQRFYRYNYIKNILFIFVIGIFECNSIVYYEKIIYGDILYLHITNHYFNITMLFFESINWVNMNLKYDYLIKWDVDIVVNIPLMFLFINIQKSYINYSGYLYNKTRVCRNKSKICYIPYSIYNNSYLPSFAASGILILSNYLSFKLDKYNKNYKWYMIRDDQYIGVICNKLLIKPIPINKYYIRVNTYNTSFDIKSLLSYHSNSISELNNLYKLLYFNQNN